MTAVANEYVTTLAEAIDTDDTEFDLSETIPTALEAGGWVLRVGDPDDTTPEYILVGSGSGTTVTGCTRGVEGSSAASWASGDVAAMVMTAATLDALIDERIELAGGGAPEGLIVADQVPATPGSEDEEFLGTADTLPTDYAWVSAAPTFTLNSEYPSWFIIERNDATERKLRVSNFAMAATSGLWMKFGHAAAYGTSDQWEFIIYDSASSNGYGFGIHNGNVALARDSNAGSLSNRGTFQVHATMLAGFIYMGVMRVSNTWETWLSLDGINWQQIQAPDTRSFTVARLEFRWSSDNAMGARSRASIDWIRYRADNEFPTP